MGLAPHAISRMNPERLATDYLAGTKVRYLRLLANNVVRMNELSNSETHHLLKVCAIRPAAQLLRNDAICLYYYYYYSTKMPTGTYFKTVLRVRHCL